MRLPCKAPSATRQPEPAAGVCSLGASWEERQGGVPDSGASLLRRVLSAAFSRLGPLP